MKISRYIIGLIVALLFSAVGAGAMPMAPTASHLPEFFPHQHEVIAEHSHGHFAARAPPLSATNVVSTGAAVAEHGNGFVMHGHESHVASLVFGVGLDAPNSGAGGFYDPRAWRQNYDNFYNGNISSTTVPPFSAPNARLAGQAHPRTNIVFDQRGFPIFDDVARYDTRFSASDFNSILSGHLVLRGARRLRIITSILIS